MIYPEIAEIPEPVKNAPIEIIQHDLKNGSLANTRELIKIIRSNRIKKIYLTDYPVLSIK